MFRVGDHVECIVDSLNYGLVLNKRYIITMIDGGSVRVNGIPLNWRMNRFKILKKTFIAYKAKNMPDSL